MDDFLPFPAFFNVEGKLCVVIGGGKVAERKIRKLLASHAKVKVISPDLTPALEKLAEKGKINWCSRKYRRGDIPKNSYFVFECTGDFGVAKAVFKECRSKKIFLNSATEPSLSDFFVPAYTKAGKILIAISTGGSASSFARALREKIEREIKGLPRKLDEIEKIRKKLMNYGEGRKRKKNSAEDGFLLDISRWAVQNPDAENSQFRKEVKKMMRKWGVKTDIF